MNTLDDYEGLKRGDWIGFEGGEWFEILAFDKFNNPFLSNNNYLKSDKVKAVLRPPFIMRDLLPKDDTPLLGTHFVQAICSGVQNNSYYYDLKFQIIHPKQEAKEGLSIDVLKTFSDLKALYWQGSEMLKKLDELEKILLASR